jgi:DNA-binding NarL/FixJ family response regulator
MTADQITPLRVLFVDDDPLSLDRASQWLAKQSEIHVVGEAASGEEGIDQVFLLKPDLVVMDLSMPTMRGHEAAQRIKRRSKATTVMLISMNNHETFIESCLDYVDGSLPKDDQYSRLIPLILALFPGRGFTFQRLSLGSAAGA